MTDQKTIEPDQQYEDAKGTQLIDEHAEHPERFHTITPPDDTRLEYVVSVGHLLLRAKNPPQESSVAWDRQPDYAPPDYSGPPPCPECGAAFHTDPNNHPVPCPPARCGPLPPPPHGFTGWRYYPPFAHPNRGGRPSVCQTGPVWFWSSLHDRWEWTAYARHSHHQIVAGNDQVEP